MDPVFVKPLAVGAVAVVLDKYALGQSDIKRSMYFGGSVAVGSALATVVTPMVPAVIPSLGSAIDGKTLTGRVMEVGLSAGSAWSLNKYVLKNDISREDWTKRLAVILASNFIAEYATDYLNNQPLSYFK